MIVLNFLRIKKQDLENIIIIIIVVIIIIDLFQNNNYTHYCNFSLPLNFEQETIHEEQFTIFSSSLSIRLRAVCNSHFDSSTLSFTPWFLCIAEGKKCSFFGKLGVLCFLETPVLRFALFALLPMLYNNNKPQDKILYYLIKLILFWGL